MKKLINTYNFKLDQTRSSEEDGNTYSYKFPILFYKRTPILFATVYTCQNRSNELQLEVTNSNGSLYSGWYDAECFGDHPVNKQIKQTIITKLLKDIVVQGCGVVFVNRETIKVLGKNDVKNAGRDYYR